jgi:hypothetical protein
MTRAWLATAAVLTCGCAMSFSGSMNVFQRPRVELATIAVENQLQADRALLALYCGEQALASEALQSIGVPRQEADRRILAALAAGLPPVNAGCVRPPALRVEVR